MKNRIMIAAVAASLLLALAVSGQMNNQTSAPKTNAEDVLKTARKAFERYDRGASGDWQPMFEMMTDDVAVRLPLPPDAPLGSKAGKERAVAIYDYVANVQKVRCKLTPTGPPLMSGNAVAFEYISAGTLGGKPVSVPLIVVFDVRGDKIAGIREYIGERGV